MDILKRFLELARQEWDLNGDLFLDREVIVYNNVSYILLKSDANAFHYLEGIVNA